MRNNRRHGTSMIVQHCSPMSLYITHFVPYLTEHILYIMFKKISPKLTARHVHNLNSSTTKLYL